jgi:CRP-like cAMP-binding protein/HEAT repeat protein
MLREALLGTDASQVIFAIDQLRTSDPEAIREAIGALSRHRSRRVRALAIGLAHDLGMPDAEELATKALADSSEVVRVAAVEALAASLREDAHDKLLELADREDDEPVRTAAIAALVRSCGLDGMLDGAPRLRALLDATEPENRVAAAQVLGLVGEASLQRSLAPLLADPALEVRRAAVIAASKVRDVRLVPQLLDALAERALAPFASRALAALGDQAIPALADRLASPLPPAEVRLAIPRILARIGTPTALAALLLRLDERNEIVRQKILASASRLRLSLAAPAVPFAEIRARIDAEMREHIEARDAYLAVRPLIQTRLVDEQLLSRLRKGIVRILRLCELAFPRRTVASVRAHVFGNDPALRANAFEVLESLLDRRLRERLVEMVESVLEMRAGRFPAPALSPREAYVATWLSGEIARGEAWSAAIALDAIAKRKLTACAPHALAALSHPDPLIREAAAAAVVATRPTGYDKAIDRLKDDPDPVVLAYVHAWENNQNAGSKPELMYSTIEKVLFLQRVPVFSRVAGEDLIFLARGSIVVSYRSGDVAFRQGDSGGAMFLVVSGKVELSVDGRTVASIGPNNVFGEMSIFDKAPRAATATVVEEAELLRVSAEDFHDAVRETVEIAEAVIQVLNGRLREADKRLAALSGSPAPVPRTVAVDPDLEARAADEHDLD